MGAYGILVVDDSAFMRKSISQIIERNPKFEVVGIARNGAEALDKVKRLRPAVVTMDVEMPEMDGLAAVERIMDECPLPVVMVSSLTKTGTTTTIRALQLGAVDCVHKDELLGAGTEAVSEDFYARLEAAAGAKMSARSPGAAKVVPRARKSEPVAPAPAVVRSKSSRCDLILIGCSTGGPAALQSILPLLKPDLSVPVLVIQHMPPGFTKSLAERFDSISKIRVKEAEDGEVLQKGWAYVAPAGRQTLLVRKGGAVSVKLSDVATVPTRFRPSVDVTLLSAAPLYRDRLATVILTGMGNDGTLGCQEVKRQGGNVIAQSEDTCVVYGMPKSVVEAGCADQQLPLDKIVDQLHQMTGV